MECVYTNNQGKLRVIQPFEYLRGVNNKGEQMGIAEDENGVKYEIFTASCDIETCYCFATAREI